MSNAPTPNTSYDDTVLGVLAYEFGFSDTVQIDHLIKAKLKEKALGPFEESRVANLRDFKCTVQKEIHGCQKSKYYTRSHGQFADIDDFDRKLMFQDYVFQFPLIPHSSIARFIDFAIYLYHLR